MKSFCFHSMKKNPLTKKMTKFDTLCRFLLPCFFYRESTATKRKRKRTPITNVKRISTNLLDEIDDNKTQCDNQENNHQETASFSASLPATPITPIPSAPPRTSRTMVIGTIFGYRRGGHIWFCVQQDRLRPKPSLLLELSISTTTLVQEMQCGVVRITLELDAGDSADSELRRCHLHSVPQWTLFCNGRKLGFAVRRKANQQMKIMLRTMKNITVGAGVIPSGSEEILYMRANYEFVVGSADSESFHLLNPEEGPGQELSIFLIRSK